MKRSWLRAASKLVSTLLIAGLSYSVPAQTSFAGDGTAVLPALRTPAPSPRAASAPCDLLSFAAAGIRTLGAPLDPCVELLTLPVSSSGRPGLIPAQLDETWNFILQAPSPAQYEFTVGVHNTQDSRDGIRFFALPFSLLTETGTSRVTPSVSYQSPFVLPGPVVAENGSYYGQRSELTGRPRTVYVRGYFRSDGTYVRSHYRSPPRR